MSEMLRASCWFRGIVATPPRVYGWRLRRFSAWHLHAIQALDLDVLDHPSPDPISLLTAALICRERRRDNLRGMLRLHNSRAYARACGWRLMAWSYARQVEVWQSYLDAYLRNLPEPLRSAENGLRMSAAPLAVKLVAFVAEHMAGVPYADAWDMPLAELACMRACHLEDNGTDFLSLETAAAAERAIAAMEGAAHG